MGDAVRGHPHTHYSSSKLGNLVGHKRSFKSMVKENNNNYNNGH